jgi:Non-repetitive/WGA-negative nucleoporin C-terminal
MLTNVSTLRKSRIYDDDHHDDKNNVSGADDDVHVGNILDELDVSLPPPQKGIAAKKRKKMQVLSKSERHCVEMLAELPSKVKESLENSVDLSYASCLPSACGLVSCAVNQHLYVWHVDSPHGFLLSLQLPQSRFQFGTAAAGLVALLANPLSSVAAHRYNVDDVATTKKNATFLSVDDWWRQFSVLVASPEGVFWYWYWGGTDVLRVDADVSAVLSQPLTLVRACGGNAAVLASGDGSLLLARVLVSPTTGVPHVQVSGIGAQQRRDQREQQHGREQSTLLTRIAQFWGGANDDAEAADRAALARQSPVRAMLVDERSAAASNAAAPLLYVVRNRRVERYAVGADGRASPRGRWPVADAIGALLGVVDGDDVRLLDAQLALGSSRLAVLAASTALVDSRRVVRYHVCLVRCASLAPDRQLTLDSNSVTLRFNPEYVQDNEEALFHSVHLLVPNVGSSAFVYWPNIVIFLQLPRDERDLNSMRLSESDERVLGVGCFASLNHAAVLVSLRYGVLALSQPERVAQPAASASSSSSHANGARGRRLDTLATSSSSLPSDAAVAYLSAEFARFRGEAASTASSALDALDPVVDERHVAALSRSIIDAAASFDPRWAEENRGQATVSKWSSVFLHRQLEEKRARHDDFVAFLEQTGYWRGVSARARWAIRNHGSLLAAVIALRRYQNELEGGSDSSALALRLLDAMQRTVQRRRVADQRQQRRADDGSGSPQDQFYNAVSRADEFLFALHSLVRDALAQKLAAGSADAPLERGALIGEHAQRVYHFVRSANAVFELMMSASSRYEREHGVDVSDNIGGAKAAATAHDDDGDGSNDSSDGDDEGGAENTCMWWWKRALRSVLRAEMSATMTLIERFERLPNARRVDCSAALFDQFGELGCLFLDSYLNALGDNADGGAALAAEFSESRRAVTRALLSHRQVDRAVRIAEQYEEFGTLMEVCERLRESKHSRHSGIAQLSDYVRRFASRRFAQFAFRWYVSNGRWHNLMTLPADVVGSGGDGDDDDLEALRAELGAELAHFLRSHPRLSWLHDIATDRFASASNTLAQRAAAEQALLPRRKTLLSLSKLCALATPSGGDRTASAEAHSFWQQLDAHMYLVRAQEKIERQFQLAIDAAVGSDASIDRNSDQFQAVAQMGSEPMTTREVIEALLGISTGNAPLPRAELKEFCFAFDVHRHCSSLQSADENRRIQQVIWMRALVLDRWPLIARRIRDEQAPSDSVTFKHIEQTIVYNLACFADIMNRENAHTFLRELIGHYRRQHLQSLGESNQRRIELLIQSAFAASTK